MKDKKLVYGVGINDADYSTEIRKTLGYTVEGKPIRKLIWICPFMCRWKDMFKRCYSENSLAKRPTYTESLVTPDWHYFTNFKAWMEKQDWQGKELDKDLLIPGNKIYGSDTCVFVDLKVNMFIVDRGNDRGEWPIGVSYRPDRGKFLAQDRDVDTGKKKHLGYFICPQEAHQAWLSHKLQQAKILAAQQNDERVTKALISRYENYQ